MKEMTVYTTHDISYFSNATLQNSECSCRTRHSPPSVSHGCASLFPEPFPAICCQTRTCTCRQAGLASAAVRLHSPVPLSHPCSFLPPSVRQRKMLDVPFTQLPLRQVGAAKLFPRHLHPRPTRSDAFDSRPKIFHSVEWMPWCPW